MIDRLIEDKCTGCNLCGDVCPQKAISYKVDEEGFCQPKVDYKLCTECGKCKKLCPALNENRHKKNKPSVFAAWSKNNKIRLESTSGGIFFELAKFVIEKKGYVYGVEYNSDWKGAHYTEVNSLEGLETIIGSKYFQADACGIYKKVKERLEQNKPVLFCGTPCQGVALQQYVNKPFNNLYVVDFICRGINSPLAFKSYLDELEEQNNSKIKYVHLKNKKTGWQSLATYVEFENGNSLNLDKLKCKWVKGFVAGDGLYMRKSCYNCQFRTIPRTADISLGDFWGINNQNEIDMHQGISCVMVNSEKGIELWNNIKSNITFSERNFDELAKGNPALRKSPQMTEERLKFFSYLKQNGFSKSVDRLASTKSQNNGLVKILRKIKNKIGFYKTINFFLYIKLNYFCSKIVRLDKHKIIPYKNSIIELKPNSKIILKGNDLRVGINKLVKSKAETHLRLEKNAVWNCNNGGHLFYNTVFEIKENAEVTSGFFSANGGSVIICNNRIYIGEDVMMGRNIIVYDSDFHQVFNDKYEISNYDKPVVIEDHVWLTSNITVLKGVTIGRDSIVSAYTTVVKDVPPNSIFAGKSVGSVIGNCYNWSRRLIKEGYY